jgi:hypothetical protein
VRDKRGGIGKGEIGKRWFEGIILFLTRSETKPY